MTERNANVATAELPSAPAGFALPPLPYGLEDLQPHLSAETLRIHHGRHHAKYVENLNRLLSEQAISRESLEDVIQLAAETGNAALFNNAAQTWNHSFFWESMTPHETAPAGALAQSIADTFGTPDKLRERFIAEGAGHFGSGWVWLVSRHGTIAVLSSHDANTPIIDDNTVPLLTCDVWEHAYYIDHRQDRATWLAVWWDKLANWRLAEQQFAAARGRQAPWRFAATAR